MKRAFAVLLSLVVATALFDVVAYVALPASSARFGPTYRRPGNPAGTSERPEPLGRGYPRFYFQADRNMGFDMTPNAPAVPTDVNGVAYEIFTNDLGCFDRKGLAEFQRAATYTYFTGDSFVWGYARYESKLATVWERRTGMPAAKCGMTHSGQRHQFAKFKQVTGKIGAVPSVVFVGFFPNDAANDFAYPHTTVVSGYQVDTVFFRNGELVRPEPRELASLVEAATHPPAFGAHRAGVDIRDVLRTYSLSSHLIDRAAVRVFGGPSQLARPRPTERYGGPIYGAVPFDVVRTRYLTDTRTLANRQAIKAWGEDAARNGYRLVFVLIPLETYPTDTEYFAGVREWLAACRIDSVDLAAVFKAGGYQSDDLYRPHDGHWTDRGNEVVGEELARRGYEH